MRSTLTLISWLACVANAAVLPRADGATAPVDDTEVHDTAITHVYVCQNAPWVAPCSNEAVNTGVCYNFINGYDNSISSIGPDVGTTCTIYDGTNCGGASFSFTNPGLSDLTSVGWNDAASSIRCV
ncbi:hypothetical protein GGR55DRAFT_641775 [Xylaria sp. FL0064]|nr:hypothetical protein GGR55DRAFT_641775 [Xylaria sp. FL0064]